MMLFHKNKLTFILTPLSCGIIKNQKDIPMAGIELSEEERIRLEKLAKTLATQGDNKAGFPPAIVKSFNNEAAIGKNFTSAEAEERLEAIYGSFGWRDAPIVLASLKSTDVFARVARRVINDDKALAAVMPGSFDKKDADLLEKCEMKSLAALVRMRL
jgi:hypothetical protein